MLFSLLTSVCTVLACLPVNEPSHRPTKKAATEGTRPALPFPVGGTGTYDQGCATFEVTVSGSSTITVTTVAGSTCGSIQPVTLGTSTWSSSTRKVRLSLALKNVATATYLPAATLISWPDSLKQVLPVAPPPRVMTFLNPDYTNPDTASVLPSARFWKYDTLLVSNSAVLQRLDPNKTSRARMIDISLGAGLTKIRVTFQSKAQLVDFAVPALPPDSISVPVMQQIYAPANIVGADSVYGGRHPRNVIVILFHVSATQTNRQAAIGSVNGEVIGGLPISDGGFYYIRIPDNGGTAALHAAIGILRANPHVNLVNPDLMGAGLNWIAPNDGANWKKADWILKPFNAAGQNRPQEAVNLPMAWGCETGDSLLRVAVVDAGFYNVTDLQTNLAPGSSTMFGKATLEHGTWVASMLAAHGSNGIAMSGAMWRAKLDYYDISQDPSIPATAAGGAWARVAYRLRHAGNSGAPIINMSLGINWQTTFLHRPSLTQSSQQTFIDSTYRRSVVNIVQSAASAITSAGHFPLFVIAAGNDSVDTWWSGATSLRDLYPTRVIVVGGSADGDPAHGPFRTGTFSSNYGPSVDIAAVGVVNAINKTGSMSGLLYGTSLAAPVISGIAGLILSANPGMPADTLKALVLAGAQRDPRAPVAQMGGAKIANAYESLRAAAERSQRPLCGNRLYAIGTEIWVERLSGQDEVLVNVGEPFGGLITQHGGRRVLFSQFSDYSFGIAVSSGSAWTIGSLIVSDTAYPGIPAYSGVSLSRWASSHDGLYYVHASTITGSAVYDTLRVYRGDSLEVVSKPGFAG